VQPSIERRSFSEQMPARAAGPQTGAAAAAAVQLPVNSRVPPGFHVSSATTVVGTWGAGYPSVSSSGSPPAALASGASGRLLSQVDL